MKQKIIAMSVDAMVYEDLEELVKFPNFKKFMTSGSRINTVRTIYPSVTYPAHVSISSGTYPNKHGVVTNDVLSIGQTNSAWNWFHDAVKCSDLFDAAKNAGLSTAAVFWPVTGNHPSIDYLVDEYWPQHESDTPKEVFLRSGTTPEVYENCVAPYMDGLVIRTHPDTDNFVVNCSCDLIRNYQPDLLMLHPGNVDAYRHETGIFSEKVTEGLHDVERWLGQLMEAAKEANVYDETVFVILSDHGMLNISRIVHLNVLLREGGFLEVDTQGNVSSCKAWSHSTALSSQIYLNDPSDSKLYKQVHDYLLELMESEVYGISAVFTLEEINEKEHLDGDFSFVVETDGYTSFGNDWNRPLVRSFDTNDYRFGQATHGHLPDKGPQPVFLLSGPGVKTGVVIERCNIVDEAPTLAKLLGVTLPQADGVCIDSLLE